LVHLYRGPAKRVVLPDVAIGYRDGVTEGRGKKPTLLLLVQFSAPPEGKKRGSRKNSQKVGLARVFRLRKNIQARRNAARQGKVRVMKGKENSESSKERSLKDYSPSKYKLNGL